MTKLKPAPSALPSVAEAERAVIQASVALDDTKAQIVIAEAALPSLALDPDDSRYETASLEIGRLQRTRLRAQARLEQARTALAEAEAAAEQDRRRALFAEGQKAAGEVDKLVSRYAEHAAAIAEVFKAIDQLEAPITAANDELPEGESRFNTHALDIYRHVELPATSESGERIWWRSSWRGDSPLVPPPPKHYGHVSFNGVLTPFDPSNPDHVAARNTPKPAALAPVAQRSVGVTDQYGERVLPDGTRKITLPKNEWPPRANTN